MNDGRAFTDYRPKCITNTELMSELRNNNMIASSYESRMYLQKNADNIIQRSQASAFENLACACTPYQNEVMGINTMQPERYIVKCNSASCYREEINPSGIGDGRQY
jgi:hypothetical protein